MKNTLKQAQFCFQNNIIIFGPQKKRKRKMKRKGVGPEGREFAGGSTERRTAWQLPHLRHGPRHRSPPTPSGSENLRHQLLSLLL